MEFNGVIKEIIETRTGISNATGEAWKKVTYLAATEELNPQLIVFDVWDGRDGRIARLNLQVGMKYRINLAFNAKKSQDGRWFNSIVAWGARELKEEQK